MPRYHFDEKEHLHTLDGKPLTGVSRVTQVIAKPLTWWAAGMALTGLGWTNPKLVKPDTARLVVAEKARGAIVKMDTPEYVALLDRCYRAHDSAKNKAATKGTDRHAELERYVKNTMLCAKSGTKDTTEYDAGIASFIDWGKQNVRRFLWSEIHCYSEAHWLGGIVDCGVELNDGGVAVIDFKSSKEAYPEQFWQCAGYDILLSENGGYTADGEKIFDLEGRKIERHIIFPFGAEAPTAQVRFDTDRNKEAFLASLTILRQIQQYET